MVRKFIQFCLIEFIMMFLLSGFTNAVQTSAQSVGLTESEKDWVNTVKINTIEAYENYVVKYPQSRHVFEARRSIFRMELRNGTTVNIQVSGEDAEKVKNHFISDIKAAGFRVFTDPNQSADFYLKISISKGTTRVDERKIFVNNISYFEAETKSADIHLSHKRLNLLLCHLAST